MSRFLVLLLVAACDAGVKTPAPAPAVAAVPPVPAKPPVPPVPPAPAPVAPTPAPAPITGAHVLLASIERGACYGTCPVYSFAVYRDGKIEYDGKDFVKRKGQATGTVTADQLAALDKLFTDAKYLAFKSSYEHEDATDSSSAKTAYRPLGARATKTVAHYYGDMHAPEALSKLEADFDTIVKIDRWIGTDAERDKLTGNE